MPISPPQLLSVPPFQTSTSTSLLPLARQPGCFPGDRRQCDSFTVLSFPVVPATSTQMGDKGKPLLSLPANQLFEALVGKSWAKGHGAPITCNSCCLTSMPPVLQMLPGQHQTHLSAGGQRGSCCGSALKQPSIRSYSQLTWSTSPFLLWAQKRTESDLGKLELADGSWNSWLLLQQHHCRTKPAYVLPSEGPARAHYFYATGRVLYQSRNREQNMFQCSDTLGNIGP